VLLVFGIIEFGRRQASMALKRVALCRALALSRQLRRPVLRQAIAAVYFGVSTTDLLADDMRWKADAAPYDKGITNWKIR
jgi:hypothetical protein